jgi:hypothetical protein
VPVVTLWIGKLIIDEVIVLAQAPGAPQALLDWYRSGLLDRLLWLLLAEFGLAVLSDLLGRLVSLYIGAEDYLYNASFDVSGTKTAEQKQHDIRITGGIRVPFLGF